VTPSPFRVLWLEIAERQYLDLPDGPRALVDERLTRLESDPAGLPDAVYNSASDQWSAPMGEHGLMLYAVVRGDRAAPHRLLIGRNDAERSAHDRSSGRSPQPSSPGPPGCTGTAPPATRADPSW
jgi:hypothetical protein